jgi:hypothetical protein
VLSEHVARLLAPWLADNAGELEPLMRALHEAKRVLAEEQPPNDFEVERVCPALLMSEFAAHGVEVPGQALSALESSVDRRLLIYAVNPSPTLCVRGRALELSVSLIGSDGKHVSFVVHRGDPRAIATDLRVEQFLHLVNDALLAHCSTRQRGIALHLPRSEPLAPGVCLSRHEVRVHSLYEMHSLRRNERGDEFVPAAMSFCAALRRRLGAAPLAAATPAMRAAALDEVRRAALPVGELSRARCSRSSPTSRTTLSFASRSSCTTASTRASAPCSASATARRRTTCCCCLRARCSRWRFGRGSARAPRRWPRQTRRRFG